MNRLEKYILLLENIFGKKAIESFTLNDRHTLKLAMRDELNNQRAKKTYQRKNEGCDFCQSIYRNPNFPNRILEFPGWIGDLTFSGTAPAKEIMIIGEAPTTLEDQINIAFGLGLYPIGRDGKLNADQVRKLYSGEKSRLKGIMRNQVKRNRLWEYINQLFCGKLSAIKPKIYITDLCKCNDDVVVNKKTKKNQQMWRNCLSKYLIEEIILINPSLIIFQGGSSSKYVTKFLEKQGSIKFVIPKIFGEFTLNGEQIYFFKIHHQAYFYRWLNETERASYINQNRQFIENKILKEILNIKEIFN